MQEFERPPQPTKAKPGLKVVLFTIIHTIYGHSQNLHTAAKVARLKPVETIPYQSYVAFLFFMANVTRCCANLDFRSRSLNLRK
jgi:hypothetical protein